MPAKIRRRIAEVAHVITAAAVLLLPRHLAAQARDVGAHARSAARAYRERNEAAIIGEVVNEHPGLIMMKTRVGGTRVVDMLSGEQLPRIC